MNWPCNVQKSARCSLVFLLLIAAYSTAAQSHLGQSRNAIANADLSGKQRVEALESFSSEMISHDPQAVIDLSEELLTNGLLQQHLNCRTRIVKAGALRRTGQATLALEELKLARSDAGQDDLLNSRIANAEGLAYKTLRDYPGALIALSEAQALAHRAGSVEDEVRAQLNLGVINRTLKRYGQARDHYKFVLANSTDSMQIARVQGNVAKLYLDELFPDSAYVLYQRSLSVFQSHGKQNNALITELNMGIALFEMGDLETARTQFAAVLQRVTKVRRRTTCLKYLGQCDYELGNYQAALNWLEQALALDKKEGGGRRGAVLGAYAGQSLVRLGRIEEAIQVCNEGLAAANNSEGLDGTIGRIDCSDCLSQAHAAMGHLSTAFDYLNTKIQEEAIRDSIEAALERDLSLAVYDFDIHQSNVMRLNEQAQAKSRSLLLGIIIALLIIFGVFITTRYRFTRRQSALISRQRLQLQQRQSDLIRTNADLEIALNHKAVFLSNMSHEIRTPLNAIVGMSNLAGKEDVPVKAKSYLRNIITASSNLIDIVNDILDFSKLEAGKLEVASEPFNVADSFEVAENVMRIPAEQKGLELVVEADASIPSHLLGDASRLNQVLINLLGNAVKFTLEGRVTVRARLSAAPALPSWSEPLDEDVAQWFVVEVSDTGIGIPEDKQEQVFESFNQGDQLKTRKFGGTGLGLSISRQIIELQNGRIWVESTEGEGSTFCFALPGIEPELTEVIAEDAGQKETIGALRILIAEDNPFNIIVTEDTLRSELPDVTIGKAENGRLAVEAVEQGDFDLVLMDIHMPELSGIEATQTIRQMNDEKKSKVLIIAMTASVLREETDNYIRNGMDGFVPKPFKIEQLMGEIRRLTSKT
ncbi:MAG: ATP-binding protein [Flavobacteriales bacterium]|nr:ATP-binding protein [Flavobacteriales bacterium]